MTIRGLFSITMKKEYFVYILRCSDGSYYTGVTNDYRRRVWEHQQGLNPTCYTCKRRPLDHVYTAIFEDIHEAIAWEHRVKGWTRKKKELLIKGDFGSLPAASKCENFSSNWKYISMRKVKYLSRWRLGCILCGVMVRQSSP